MVYYHSKNAINSMNARNPINAINPTNPINLMNPMDSMNSTNSITPLELLNLYYSDGQSLGNRENKLWQKMNTLLSWDIFEMNKLAR